MGEGGFVHRPQRKSKEMFQNFWQTVQANGSEQTWIFD